MPAIDLKALPKEEQERLLRLAASRGERMQEIVDTLGIEDVLDALREQAVDAMVEETDRDRRDRLQVMAKTMADIKANIRAGIQNGRMSRKELEQVASGRRPFF